jgi:SAM-dependent methyltransferase
VTRSQHRSLSFGAEAAAYERGRPSYPPDAIDWLLPQGARDLPDTPALLGTAEEIPLPDDSVDAVLVAQAWHWFDTERAVKEVARVLRPGGRLGLVWNARDERLGWVKELGRIIGHEDAHFNDKTTLPDVFTDVEHHKVEWTNYLTPQALIDLVASRSYCITSPEKVRTRTLDRVRELLATHPALANTNGLALPYVTVCIRASLA